MPVFKADFAEYNRNTGSEQNMMRLFEAHNHALEKIAQILNNLDEENLNPSVRDFLKEENHGDESSKGVGYSHR